jgi:hypothetical protein
MARYEVLIYGVVPQRIEVDAPSRAEAEKLALEDILERLQLCSQQVGEEKCRELSQA